VEYSCKSTLQLITAAAPPKQASQRPQPVCSVDQGFFLGVLHPWSFAGKLQCVFSAPLHGAENRGGGGFGKAIKASASPVLAVADTLLHRSVKGLCIATSWSLAAALDCGWAGTLGCALDSKAAGASVGWKLANTWPLTMDSSIASTGTAVTRSSIMSTQGKEAASVFRKQVQGGRTAVVGTSVKPAKKAPQLACSFAGRVGSVASVSSAAPSSLSSTLSVAAALQPWSALRSLPLQDSARRWSAALTFQLKHSPNTHCT
jgi:hypothetical protein